MPKTNAAYSALSPKNLCDICDEILDCQQFDDYCPNGLQVDADRPITRVITGVTASLALIEQAIEKQADAILVHHGYFWKGEPQTLTGIKGRRIRMLLQHNISLFAYHLPLDAHKTFGNNAILCQNLGLKPIDYAAKNDLITIACGKNHDAQTLKNTLERVLKRNVLHIDGGQHTLQKIGICTGGAQDYIKIAHKAGCDAFITGEISERTTHLARELGVHFYACGHHDTEKGGVQALGQHLAATHNLLVEFVDIPNPA